MIGHRWLVQSPSYSFTDIPMPAGQLRSGTQSSFRHVMLTDLYLELNLQPWPHPSCVLKAEIANSEENVK